ncbi:transglutaminase domain-containing protein [Pleurocapsales cyanobacterium LEGE 10410]|nr:transglutaminase domain-containing protein [Pleurocapsales cyanobacterium LEGE 10410]
MKLPPFLLGATLLFWGWQTGFWIIAIPLAIIYESSRYINWRWNLATADFRSTSHICTVLLVGVLIYLLVSDRSLQLIFSFFQWLPVICSPLVIAQAYSTSDRVDLHALLVFKEQANQKQLFPLDLTYPYFALCILAASAANVRDLFFYAGAVFLIGHVLITIRSKRFSVLVFISLLILATALGAAGHIGLHRGQIALQQNTARFFYRFYRPQTDPNQITTAIGDIGSVKQSNKIVLRLKPASGQIAPTLIRQATYNKYSSGFWGATKAEFVPIKAGNNNTWILENGYPEKREVTISENLDEGRGLLKLPQGSFRVNKLPVEKVEQNQYGTVQAIAEPSFLSYQIQYNPQLSFASPPTAEDLQIPKLEQSAIARIINELELASKSPQEILSTVNRFFSTEFSYSLKLARQRRDRTPLSAFLLRHRSGHCEYFATATTLLLRGVGIPTRYTVGYSVHELSRLERQYVVRARHAHAWTQVYINGKWQAFDTTPASWIAIEDNAASNWQHFQDLTSLIGFQFSQLLAIVKNIEIRRLWWLIFPLGFILVRFSRQRQKRRLTALRIKQNAVEYNIGADSEIYLIERELNKLGLAREQAETWQNWLKRLQNASDNSAIFDGLYAIVKLHYRYRFDPHGIGVREREQLRSACRAWLEQYQSTLNSDR